MEAEEAKRAFIDRVPVVFEGARYEYINALRYCRNELGQIMVAAELYDKSGNCVVIARLREIEVAEK